jgi:phosphohistidine phosphatase
MTCDLVVKKLNRHIDIDYNPIIYDNNAREIIKLVAQTDDKINNLMIIGHNPSMHKIVEYLINNDFPYPKFSTSGVALINFNINKWASISDNYGLLEFFTTPKMLKAN